MNMIIDPISLWIGRIFVITIAIGIIALIWHWLMNIFWKNCPAYKFALCYWIRSKSDKSIKGLTCIKMNDGWYDIKKRDEEQ